MVSWQDIILEMNIKKTKYIMINARAKTTRKQAPFNVEPILRKVMKQAQKEHEELQHVFRMMGWSGLPDLLKIEIKEDVIAMVDELKGRYSTCDAHVLKRRKSITYWVGCYRDGICSLHTAIEALKVKKL